MLLATSGELLATSYGTGFIQLIGVYMTQSRASDVLIVLKSCCSAIQLCDAFSNTSHITSTLNEK